MRSRRAAAQLLSSVSSVDSLAPIAAALGCRGSPLPLGRGTADALGIGEWAAEARIAAGPGALRALLCECIHPRGLREGVSAIAARLSTRAPHLLWALLAVAREHDGLVLASWSADRARPRIVALVVDRTRVVDSDAETLCALAAAGAEGPDVMIHARWLEILGRDALSRRFYHTLERVVAALAAAAPDGSASDRHEVALLLVSRLIFLSFLEAKGWLDGDHRFLGRGFDACLAGTGEYHRRVLLPLFFGTLNTAVADRARIARAFGRIPFLNGGLFGRAPVERRAPGISFPDEALGLVFGELLGRYRFTAREDSAAWSEAAIDPEMLGKSFESLMGARIRRSSGAFYTPHAIVASVTREALRHALSAPGIDPLAVESALLGHVVDGVDGARLRERVESLTVLDPACGSGAFLVHVLEELAALGQRLGDTRSLAALRRDRVTRAIFGVDVNPMAVWLCQLRLWLSVVIETEADDPMSVLPLPNLDRHIRVGDSLAGDGFDGPRRLPGAARVAQLRERYARANGPRKRTLERALDREERAHALAYVDGEIARCAARRLDLIVACRGRDLFGARHAPTAEQRDALAECRLQARQLRAKRRSLRERGALPFSFVTHFPDIAARGGFDVVLGNPPWVRLHRICGREELRLRYVSFRRAAWERGAALARAGPGFGAQVDLAALFIERSLTLARDDGLVALLVPSKLWRSLAGGGVRRLLAESSRPLSLGDWSESGTGFDAAVYPSLIVARRAGGSPGVAAATTAADREPSVAVTLHRRTGSLGWLISADRLRLDADPASPWLALPPTAREGFDRLLRAGPALADSDLGPLRLGVKCGCNDAFVVSLLGAGCGSARVRGTLPGGASREGLVELDVLRPLLRGESVARWSPASGVEYLVWTHGALGEPLDILPSHLAHWLAPWRRRLAARSDCRSAVRWWSLFRTAAAEATGARVVWADMGRFPRALVLEAGDPTVPLNSCYVLSCRGDDDAYAMSALLNSPLVGAWLNALGEPARGGYRRYLAWTVALLPIPRDWGHARRTLAPIGREAHGGCPPGDDELLVAAHRAYRIRPGDVKDLLAWCAG